MSNIISIILILTSIGIFFGFIDPTYGKIKEARLEKADYDKALTNSTELKRVRDTHLKKYSAMSPENLQKLEKLLPDNIDNVRLIIDIDEMAKTHQMRIRNFKTTTSEKTDVIGSNNSPYGTLTLSFSTSASYNTFIAFLRDLERSLRVLDITSVSFTAGDGQVYDYNVTVKTYWLK